MRRLILSFVVLAQLVVVPAVSASDSGSIPAQVTMDAPCITVASGALDFGTKRFDTLSSLQKTFSLCHSSGGAYVYGSATNATSTGSAAWTLVTSPVACLPTPVLDRYSIFAGVSPDAGGPSSNTYLGSAPARLYNAQPGPLTLYTNLNTPCDGSSGAGQLMTFTIQLTASFS